MTDMLSDPVARQVGFGYGAALRTTAGAAVKTGTSSAFRDNWTLGYTRDRAVGVWVGNVDGRPMVDVSGVDGAAPIWRDVMEAATEGTPHRPFAPPDGLVRATVCTPTGEQPGASCPSPVQEWFVAGTEPEATEQYYVATEGGLLAARAASEAQAWGLDAGLRLAPGGSDQAVHVTSPAPASVLYVAPELRVQQVLLRASVPAGAVRVEFRLDGRPIGTVEGADARLAWGLEPGAHHLEVIATLPDGSTVHGSTEFEVMESRGG
ncbi:MAG: hypothetical protein GEU80_12285 [Dehalococcoidia bacterium]|nr:hypothetical protein [Dehalococcoidia bacterium]